MNVMQGTLDVLVLRSLRAGPQHGYGITSWIRQCTDGDLEVEDGALYQALHRLEHRGVVQASWGVTDNNRRARYYKLTARGRREPERSATLVGQLDCGSFAASQFLDLGRENVDAPAQFLDLRVGLCLSLLRGSVAFSGAFR